MKTLSLLLLLSFCISAAAQNASPPCPTVKVMAPDSMEMGGKLRFSANIQGGDRQVTPTYNWMVSAGSISSGQGTATIEMDLTGVAGDSTITASVEIGGYARTCATFTSTTTLVLKKAEARKVDEYGKLEPKEAEERLNKFLIELLTDPTAKGYLLAYGGRTSRPDEAQKAANKDKVYLIKQGGLALERVVVVDGGYREQPVVELWIVPSGAAPPQAAPTVKPGEVKAAGTVKR